MAPGRAALQIEPGNTPKGRRVASALEIALEQGNHALVLLLLCNGYDPNLERESPLDLALRRRRWDLVDLLLEWGADPHQADLGELFDTYQSHLFERFRALGVDLTANHELAAALAYHTSNKPLFGFARRHRKHDPRIQAELNVALAHHASEGNEKGVNLCLWAGADPRAPACSLRWSCHCDEDDTDSAEDGFRGFSAIHEACQSGNARVLKRLGPDPSRDDFEDLYRAADSSSVIDLLAEMALPKDVGALIQRQLWWISIRRFDDWGSLQTLRRIFEVGARWESSSRDKIAGIRSRLIKISDRRFVDLMKLLAEDDYCSPEILKELGRTPAMRRRMTEVGFIPTPSNDSRRSGQLRPTRSREVLRKFGVELPKPKRPVFPLPHTVRIGSPRDGAREVRFERAEFFECVWSEPMVALAEKWGLSDRGLAKACGRIKVPVPPRGYWAKVQAGHRVRRPRLPKLPPEEAEAIVIWEAE